MKSVDFLKDMEFIGIMFSEHHLGDNILPQTVINFMSLLE